MRFLRMLFQLHILIPFRLRVIVSLGGETITRIIAPIVLLGSLASEFEEARQIHYAFTDPERAVFGYAGCGDPCIVDFNRGGVTMAFTRMGFEILAQRKRLIINGPCASACAIMADIARPFTCITPRASFHFHMGFIGKIEDGLRFEPYASEDIKEWVMDHGGFPTEGLLPMYFPDAVDFWEVCTLSAKGDRIAAM